MFGVLAAFALGAVACWAALTFLRRPVPDDEPAILPSARPLGGLRASDRSQDALLAAFRSDELPDPADALREDQRIIADALRDIAKRRGAAAAVLWALDEDAGGVATPVGSSADDARTSATPAHLPVVSPEDRQRVEWSARNRMMTLEQPAGRPLLAIVPLEAAGLPGALSLHYAPEQRPDVEALRGELGDHARAMQALYGLVRTRSDLARANFRLRGLVRTALTLQATRDPLELERLLALDSLPVAGAEWSLVVRWDPTTNSGTARAAAGKVRDLGIDFDAHVVPADSHVGQVATDGRPLVWADARAITRGADAIFGSAVGIRGVGSLIVVPVRRGEHERPIGAVVCGHSQVAAMRAIESRNLRNLAVIAAGALESAWAVEDAERSARTDPLTGLTNRRGFDERFAQVVQETDRYGAAAALILVDVDHFKRVNDTYGHDAGDQVLVAVANALAEGRRTVDTVARLGGEELAVLLPQTDAGGAREVAERIRRRLEVLSVHTTMGEVRVSASFGVAEYAARQGRPEQVVERADQALYAAKRNGRNRVEVVA
ncbi:MAG: GGDEF domain-containing protein [Gemmatimonadaceae bacterium]|nr:GGDEF domain-containing protein [Gemmatimonadaceae bacterium]